MSLDYNTRLRVNFARAGATAGARDALDHVKAVTSHSGQMAIADSSSTVSHEHQSSCFGASHPK